MISDAVIPVPALIHFIILIAIIILLLSLVLGLVRSYVGPSLEDRFTALLLLGTGGAAMLLLLSVLLSMPALYDVALVLALLAVIITVALTKKESDDD